MGPDWRDRHLWQIQPVRDLLVIAGAIALVYLGYVARVVTVPMLIALALAYLFEPVVRWATRSGRASRRWAALAVITFASVIILVPVVLGTGFALVQGVEAAEEVASNVAALRRSVENPKDEALKAALPNDSWRKLRDRLVEMRPQPPGEAPPEEQPQVPLVYQAADWLIRWVETNADALGKSALRGGAGAVETALRTLKSIGFVAFGAFLTAFFFYYFCTGYGDVLSFWERLIPERKKGRVFDLLEQMDRVIAGFVRGRLTIALILGAFVTVAYWLAGVPAPLLFGPLIGLLFLLPYVHVVGVPLAMLAMWLEPSSWAWQNEWWWVIGAPIGVYLCCQLLDDYVLTPKIQGRATGLDAPSVLFASMAGGAIAGVYGLLLAIPVAACIKILLKEVFWPRVKAWGEGRERDFLPIGRE